MANQQKRAELKEKIDAAEKRNEQRSLGDYARDAADNATSFAKEHPITTLAGAVAVGVLVASVVPGPGRRLRKRATKRGAVLAGIIADLAVTYGAQALEGASSAAHSGQDKIGDGARSLRRSAEGLLDDAGSLGREVGKSTSRTLRSLRSRIAD